MNPLNLHPDKDFYFNDMSGLRFEEDFTKLIMTNYPAWSLEEHFVKHMQKQSEPYLYFKPEETVDGQPHIFHFEFVTDQHGNEWYSYLGYE